MCCLLIVLLVTGSGCASFLNVAMADNPDPESDVNRIRRNRLPYPATQLSIIIIKRCWNESEIIGVTFFSVVDFPLSVCSDTLFLPLWGIAMLVTSGDRIEGNAAPDQAEPVGRRDTDPEALPAHPCGRASDKRRGA